MAWHWHSGLAQFWVRILPSLRHSGSARTVMGTVEISAKAIAFRFRGVSRVFLYVFSAFSAFLLFSPPRGVCFFCLSVIFVCRYLVKSCLRATSFLNEFFRKLSKFRKTLLIIGCRYTYLLYGSVASLPSPSSNIEAWPYGTSLRFASLLHLGH